MTIIVRRPWTRQPQFPTVVDRASPLMRDLIMMTQGMTAMSPTGTFSPVTLGSGATFIGDGFAFSGASSAVVGWDFGSSQIAAADAVTISAIVSGSSFPSLAHIAGWSSYLSLAGEVNPTLDSGVMRSILAFTAGPPCDIYYWGGNNDFDSNVQFLTVGAPQHIVVTKAAGTGAVEIRVYRNGVQVSSGTSSNSSALTDTGRYFYIGGRHFSASNSITGSIRGVMSWRRVLSNTEVWALSRQLLATRRIIIPVGAAAATAPTLSDLRAINVGATSVQWSIDYTFA